MIDNPLPDQVMQEKETLYVNEKYDEGKILFQKSTPIFDNDEVASLSSRIHNLEYKYYPQIIEKYLLNQL